MLVTRAVIVMLITVGFMAIIVSADGEDDRSASRICTGYVEGVQKRQIITAVSPVNLCEGCCKGEPRKCVSGQWSNDYCLCGTCQKVTITSGQTGTSTKSR